MSVAEQLVAAFEPWLTDDGDLQDYLEVTGEMFELVETYSDDQADGTPGMVIMLDPDNAPAGGLPYLAQWVGERLSVGLTEAAQREWIKDAPNQQRGTILSIARAAQRYLIGDRLVAIIERDTGPDRLTVITFTQETPNRAAVLAELMTVVPADISLTYIVSTGVTWSFISSTYASWSTINSTFDDWADLASNQSGGTVIGR